ncbi:hypothetical protein GQ457_15G015940 [Hibiscus cannabinus]
MVKNMQRQSNPQEVKALDAFCELCGNNHDASECGQAPESSCYVGNFNKNVILISNPFPDCTSGSDITVGTSYVKTSCSEIINFLCPTRDPCTITENKRKS